MVHPWRMVEVARLANASQVVVVTGAAYDPKHRKGSRRLASEQDPAQIRLIAELLTDIVPSRSQSAWMEWPAVAIAFVRGAEVLAEFGLLGRGDWIRVEPQGDQRLADPARVVAWLAARGVDLA